jgi:hypothetical protein
MFSIPHIDKIKKAWETGESLGVKAEQGWEVRPDQGAVFFALQCKSCKAPIPIIKLNDEDPVKLPSCQPDTYFLSLCVNEDCRNEHIYRPTDIYAFRWPGRDTKGSNNQKA